MTMTIDAVYEAGMFRPIQPGELADLDLAEGKQVKLTVDAANGTKTLPPGPDPSRVAEIMAEIAALAVPHGEPDFGGRDHDLILYGGPEGAR